MELYQSIVMGIIQGLGEFLPISSSAHLILVPNLLKWPDFGQTFDVSLHLGTLVSVAVYFRQDIISLLKGFIDSIKTRSLNSFESKLCWYIIIATIPGAVAGKMFEEVIEENVRNSPNFIAMLLMAMGFVLIAADHYGRKLLTVKDITFKSSFAIGLAQALALVPGFSRSGITITAGLFAGLKNDAAARFSFLLSMPIIFGAALLKGVKIFKTGIGDVSAFNFSAGIITSAIVGYAAISFLLNYVQTKGYKIFAVYRLIFGATVIALSFLKK